MADEYLAQLWDESPDTEEIILDYKEVEDVTPLLPEMSKFRSARILSLVGNSILRLPPDLSCLTSVTEVNLNENTFENLEEVIISLTTIPLLNSIHINLHEEEQVDFIFRTMPNLQYLNDNEVERDELSGQDYFEGEEEEEEVDDDQAPEYQEQEPEGEDEIMQEEMEQEMEQEIEEEPLEVEPEVEVEDEEEGEGEDTHLVVAEPEQPQDVEELDIKSDDLEAIAVLYDQIRSVRRQEDAEGDKDLAEDFDRHLKDVMFELSDQLKANQPTHSKNAHILKAKFSLYEICFTKAQEYLHLTNEDVGTIFGKIAEGHGTIFEDFFNLIGSCNPPEPDESDLKAKLEQNEKETAEVIEAANNLNKQYESELEENKRLKATSNQEIQQLKKQLKTSEAENS